MPAGHQNRLIWIDLEMTGLNPEEHVILEIASVVTDDQLEIVAEGPNIAVNVREDALDRMEDWSRVQHEKSGLLDRVRNSPDVCRSAEEKTLEFLSKHCDKEESPLCGNSVWQDRRFLHKHMPRLEAFLHYRVIDVSSIKELVRRWYPQLPIFEKRKSHLALDDIKESIEELKYYRQQVFRLF
ncbi:MAG: oligoribonuclease [Deltaproteobacteria bacterium]|nr:oligoribonuclease [Deltaproteobacteria bacterium]